MQLLERTYKRENQRPRRYDGQFGFIVLINNQIVVINSLKKE